MILYYDFNYLSTFLRIVVYLTSCFVSKLSSLVVFIAADVDPLTTEPNIVCAFDSNCPQKNKIMLYLHMAYAHSICNEPIKSSILLLKSCLLTNFGHV